MLIKLPCGSWVDPLIITAIRPLYEDRIVVVAGEQVFDSGKPIADRDIAIERLVATVNNAQVERLAAQAMAIRAVQH